MLGHLNVDKIETALHIKQKRRLVNKRAPLETRRLDKLTKQATHNKTMKTFFAAFAGISIALPAFGQVTIRSADMFSQPGQYYRAYFNSQAIIPQPIPIREYLGELGGGNLWDFTDGPTNEIVRVDYINPEGTVFGHPFPGVTLAERISFESGNRDPKWLFIEQTPLVGRKVFGFYESTFAPPSQAFDPPIVDFPDPMRFGDKWSTTVSWKTAAFGFDLIRYTQVSEFEVDAYGIIELPNLGFGDALRVNAKVTTTQAVPTDFVGGGGLEDEPDDGGGFTNVGANIFRALYFFRPGFGLVAEIHSTQSEADPGSSFHQATFFSRMFETNRTPPKACNQPSPVNDLEISLSAGRALLKWNITECTDFYRVEYSALGGIAGSWRTLGETQNTFMVDSLAGSAPMRLYRVISRKVPAGGQ